MAENDSLMKQVEELANTMWRGEPVPGRVLRFGAGVLGLAEAAPPDGYSLPTSVVSLISRMRDRLYVLAMEDADCEDQADAASLAQEADALLSSPIQTHACHCDLENTLDGIPDACVFDGGNIEHCRYAAKLQSEGKAKTDCQYWLPVTVHAFGQRQG